nr:hypothetical protein CFP56_08373 [Quercus suber]
MVTSGLGAFVHVELILKKHSDHEQHPDEVRPVERKSGFEERCGSKTKKYQPEHFLALKITAWSQVV